MPDPLVVTQANAFRAALLRREATQLRAMTARWLTVERALEQGIADMLAEIDTLRAGGRVFGRNHDPYLQLERYRALLAQTRRELAKFAEYATGSINRGIAKHAQLGVEQATAQIATAMQAAGVTGSFNRMSTAAVENLVGVLQDGAPVGELLRASFPEAAVRMTDALVEGTALGLNPRVTAANMARGLGDAVLQQCMVVARTEQLRSLRTASLTSMRQSSVVRGYMRLASKSSRSCLPCLLADGTVYELESEFEAHPNCRCQILPLLIGRPDPTFTQGRDWFLRQSAPVQRDIMHPGAWRAWKDGAVGLDDLVLRRENATWGASLIQKPLRDAIGEEAAMGYIRSAFFTQD